MSDATLENYNALAGALMLGQHPLLPRPEWGQDAAYVAFVIDGLRAENERLRAVCDAARVIDTGWWFGRECVPAWQRLRSAILALDRTADAWDGDA